jgi:hypothetical protein
MQRAAALMHTSSSPSSTRSSGTRARSSIRSRAGRGSARCGRCGLRAPAGGPGGGTFDAVLLAGASPARLRPGSLDGPRPQLCRPGWARPPPAWYKAGRGLHHVTRCGGGAGPLVRETELSRGVGREGRGAAAVGRHGGCRSGVGQGCGRQERMRVGGDVERAEGTWSGGAAGGWAGWRQARTARNRWVLTSPHAWPPRAPPVRHGGVSGPGRI